MSSGGGDYLRRLDRLVQEIRAVNEADRQWSPTPERKRYEDFAARAEEFAERILGLECTDVEAVHDELRSNDRGEVVNGYPCMKSIRQHVLDLAESARVASDRLPNPRARRALPFAALGLLRLRYEFGFPRPALSNSSADVVELDQVCRAAGLVLSRERLRGALAEALSGFKPA